MPATRTDFGAMDLNLLHALVALVDERSTTVAARRLGLAQSTVSGTLARLRQTFGDALLVRQGRGLEPTPRALELVAACRPHLDGLVSAIGATAPFDPTEDANVFRLGCTDAVALTVLPRLTEVLRREAPRCDLVVRVGDYRVLPDMLAASEIATALAYLRDSPSATAKTRVLRHSPWVVLRDPDQPPVEDLADFCERPHALVTPAGDLDGFVDVQLAGDHLSRRVALGVTSFALLIPALR
ncbi:MAG: LysR family transcriptional regulator, partial [Pseudomonadota bacterium]